MTTNTTSIKDLLAQFVTDGKSPTLLKFVSENFDKFHSHMTLFKQAYQLYAVDTDNVSKDAWSTGQLSSKLWLLEELSNRQLDLGNVWVLCGWVGTLPMMMHYSTLPLHYNYIRSFDIDDRCAMLADTLNRPQVRQTWQFKASTADVNNISYRDFKFTTTKYDGTEQTIVESADTVINTSCDHMSNNIWWDSIPVGTLVVLQNNNFAEVEEHVNNVADINEFKLKYPMTELLYEGTLDCGLYNRYMLIGKK